MKYWGRVFQLRRAVRMYSDLIYFICVACSVGRFGVDCQELCQCERCDAASGSCPGIVKT